MAPAAGPGRERGCGWPPHWPLWDATSLSDGPHQPRSDGPPAPCGAAREARLFRRRRFSSRQPRGARGSDPARRPAVEAAASKRLRAGPLVRAPLSAIVGIFASVPGSVGPVACSAARMFSAVTCVGHRGRFVRVQRHAVSRRPSTGSENQGSRRQHGHTQRAT